ncbi:hypothetical protein P167DRAFT_550038 [Morchella conica CCBAS932]|uniref:Uncharacterized protein n=1 Tax=Morchella conica CCBAS932 TaxID=1392247 RepID=A0A3N4K9G7_9PEZI|nr:hypothetical protein P167DRAFT_550038 [Morchella conica CCBAS932]
MNIPLIPAHSLWDLAITRHNLTQLRNTLQQYEEKLATLEPQIQCLRRTDDVRCATESDPTLYGLQTTAALASLSVLFDAQDRSENHIVVLQVKIHEVEKQLGALLQMWGVLGTEAEAIIKSKFDMRPVWGLREKTIELMTELLQAQKKVLRMLAEFGNVQSEIGGNRDRQGIPIALLEELKVAEMTVLNAERRASEWNSQVEKRLEEVVTTM